MEETVIIQKNPSWEKFLIFNRKRFFDPRSSRFYSGKLLLLIFFQFDIVKIRRTGYCINFFELQILSQKILLTVSAISISFFSYVCVLYFSNSLSSVQVTENLFHFSRLRFARTNQKILWSKKIRKVVHF